MALRKEEEGGGRRRKEEEGGRRRNQEEKAHLNVVQAVDDPGHLEAAFPLSCPSVRHVYLKIQRKISETSSMTRKQDSHVSTSSEAEILNRMNSPTLKHNPISKVRIKKPCQLGAD